MLRVQNFTVVNDVNERKRGKQGAARTISALVADGKEVLLAIHFWCLPFDANRR